MKVAEYALKIPCPNEDGREDLAEILQQQVVRVGLAIHWQKVALTAELLDGFCHVGRVVTDKDDHDAPSDLMSSTTFPSFFRRRSGVSVSVSRSKKINRSLESGESKLTPRAGTFCWSSHKVDRDGNHLMTLHLLLNRLLSQGEKVAQASCS